MKCQVCGSTEATIHFKELKGDEMHELHLCPACAEEKGFHTTVEQDKTTLMNQFIWMAENLIQEGETKVGTVQCASCGLRYAEFTRIGRLGCPDCYTSFDSQMRRLLRRVHGSIRHEGKTRSPGTPRYEDRSGIHRLQEELQRAIAAENFELAAELRDRIRAMEKAPAHGEEAGS